MNSILLPVDGSQTSLRAVAYVLKSLEAFITPPLIHLLHVHPPIPLGRIQSHVGAETLRNHYREESEACLKEAEAQLNAAGARYVPHIHVGQAAEVIVHQAEELACDSIVMGTRGHGALASLALGSVVQRVVHLAKCPVILIK